MATVGSVKKWVTSLRALTVNTGSSDTVSSTTVVAGRSCARERTPGNDHGAGSPVRCQLSVGRRRVFLRPLRSIQESTASGGYGAGTALAKNRSVVRACVGD